jgi:tetratricopeptide (TPR) repeat protein
MVGEEMVRADRGTPAATAGTKVESCHLVPLLQMRAGELSQQVRLTYFVPAKEGASIKNAAAMDDPELVGLSVERTLWNVWVPQGYELDEFDGNMEEVVEEVIEDEKVQQKLSDVLRLNRIVSTSNSSEYDVKEALGNATKALEEVNRYQESKKSKFSRSSADSKPAVTKRATLKEGDEEVRFKSNAQLEQQLKQQEVLLTENRVRVGMLSKSGSGTWQVQMEQSQFPGTGSVSNTWNYNKDAAAQKTKEGKVVLQGANTVLNDNVAVSNDFLTRGDAPVVLPPAPAAKATAPQMDQPQMPALQGNVTLNNARGAANFLQADGAYIAGQEMVVPAQPAFSGSISSSGNLADSPRPNMGLAPAAPATADPFAPVPPAPSLPAGAVPFGDAPSNSPLGAPQPGAVRRYTDLKKNLQLGYSHLNLGNMDQASAALQEVLRVDPNNRAARRGQEDAQRARTEYFRTTGDHTRARMLNEVNRGWEDPVPVQFATPQLKPQGRVSLPVDVPLNGTVYHFRKLKDHAALELDIDKPLEPQRKVALWILAGGALVIAGVEWAGRKRRARSQQVA